MPSQHTIQLTEAGQLARGRSLDEVRRENPGRPLDEARASQIIIEASKEDYTTIDDFGSRLKDVERSGIVTWDTKGRILFSCRMDPC